MEDVYLLSNCGFGGGKGWLKYIRIFRPELATFEAKKSLNFEGRDA